MLNFDEQMKMREFMETEGYQMIKTHQQVQNFSFANALAPAGQALDNATAMHTAMKNMQRENEIKGQILELRRAKIYKDGQLLEFEDRTEKNEYLAYMLHQPEYKMNVKRNDKGQIIKANFVIDTDYLKRQNLAKKVAVIGTIIGMIVAVLVMKFLLSTI